MPVEIGLGLSPVLPDGRPGTPFVPSDLGLRAWYDAELGQPKNVGYVQLDGTSGDYITTPDSAALSFSNDIEVVMRVYCNDWTAAANQTLCGKYVTTSNQRSFRFYVSTAGAVVLTASADGTAVVSDSITPSSALTDATWVWLRMRLDLTNGSNSVATLETAADNGSNGTEPSSWTANGTQTGTALAGIYDSTAPLEIGTFQNGMSERFSGRIGRCIVRSGFAGTTVADFNADDCYGPGYLNEGSLPTSGGSAYVPLRGVSGDYIWTADKAALRVTGDIEIVARVASSTWSSNENFVTRWGSPGAQAFAFQAISSSVRFFISTDGTNALGALATANHGFTAGTPYWVKVTRRASDGRVQFFTAPDSSSEPSSWTQLGADVTLSAGSSIFAAAAPLELGSQQGGTVTRLSGGVFRAIVRSGIGGTTVADFNAANATAFGLPSDGVGNGWLIADPKHHGNWTLGLPKIYDRSGNGVAPATFGAGSNQPTWLPWKGYAGVYNPGQAGNFVSCPTSAALDITGDVDLRATVWLASLTAAQNQTLVGTMRNGDLTGFMFHVSATGFLQTFHGNGAAVLTTTCPASLASAGLIPGREYELRATIDVNDGAGNHVVKFYTADAIGGTWTQLGDTVTTAGTTSIFDSATVVAYGKNSATTAVTPVRQRFYGGRIYQGIAGTLRSSIDTSTLTAGAATFSDGARASVIAALIAALVLSDAVFWVAGAALAAGAD